MKGTSRFIVGLTLTVSLLTCVALAQTTPEQPTPPPAEQPVTPPADPPMDMPADPAAPATPAPTSSDMSTTMMDQVDMSKTFTMTDKNFAIKMHTGNNYEIAAAQIALTKSSSAAVKAFAQQMITDHTSMDQLLMNAVRSIKPEHMVPGLLTPKQQLMLDRLNAATVDFDAEYKAQMIESHQETLDLLQMFIDSKYGNTVLKGVAQGAVPVVTMHLQMAQGLVL